jgi:alkylated DNA repair dioxygenase AlkB
MEDQRINLTNNSWITTVPNFIQYDNETFEQLWSLRPIEDQFIRMFGKEIKIPRKQAFYANNNVIERYNFSGNSVEAKDITTVPFFNEQLENIRNLNENNRECYNSIFVNWYDNGEKIGKHSDKEKSLIKEKPIYSVTLQPQGDPRTFILRPKKNITDTIGVVKIPLEDKSLVIMGGNIQTEYTHEVPKGNGKRINLTIRAYKILKNV